MSDSASASAFPAAPSPPGAANTALVSPSQPPNEDNDNASSSWTRFLPQAFEIRQSVEDSPFRWCAREAAMWGVATGTAMGIHRLRMKSHPLLVVNVAFATVLVVTAPSYYFCFRRREHQERTIEMMMAANDITPGEKMPEPVPVNEDHPFLRVGGEGGEERSTEGLQKEFVARLKEKKKWQAPHRTEDANDVFQEVQAPRKK